MNLISVKNLLVCSLMGILLFTSGLAFGARQSAIKIEPVLKSALVSVLDSAADLHKACFDQNEEKIEASLRVVLGEIQHASSKTSLAPNLQTHLLKVLNAAKENLEMSQMQKGKNRVKSLKKAFESLVQIKQVYKVGNYKMFFCSKDKGVWLQRSWKAENPFHPQIYKDCGKPIY